MKLLASIIEDRNWIRLKPRDRDLPERAATLVKGRLWGRIVQHLRSHGAPPAQGGAHEVLVSGGGGVLVRAGWGFLCGGRLWRPARDNVGVRPARFASRLQLLRSLGWRDYQLAAIESAGTAPLGRSVIRIATGGGKSRVAWGLAFCAGGQWGFTVGRREICAQMRRVDEGLRKLVWDRLGVDTHAWFRLQPMMYSELERLGGASQRALAGLIVDECHEVAAPSRVLAVDEVKATWKCGLSATPFERSDGRNALVGGVLGAVQFTLGFDDLVKKGNLAKGSVHVISVS